MNARFDLKWLRNWIFPALWTLQIFYFSLLPRAAYPKIDQQHFATSYLQYLYHFGQYFILSLLVYRATVCNSVSSAPACEPRDHVLNQTLLVIAVIAFLDELIQIPVPARTFALRDLMADAAGGGFGLVITRMSNRLKIFRGRHWTPDKLDRSGKPDPDKKRVQISPAAQR